MGKNIIIYIICLYSSFALAQDVLPVSVGSNTNSSGTIDYVVGDLVSDSYINSSGFINVSFLNIVFENSSLSISTNEILNPDIKLYPNPASDKLFISGLERFNYALYDVKGVKLMTNTYNDGIVISQLQKGVYYLQVIKENNVKSFKIIKQ